MSSKNSDIRQKILSLLKQYTLSTREISHEIGATYTTTLKYLEILQAGSMIEHKVYGKTKVWSLKTFNPFQLNSVSLLYQLAKKLWEESRDYKLLKEVLNSFYLSAIEINREKIKNLSKIQSIQKFSELETGLKWKEIDNYDILNEDESQIEMKIFDCKYKFGCCANLQEENIDVFCIVGQKFSCLLNFESEHDYESNLTNFSIDPNTCIIRFSKTT